MLIKLVIFSIVLFPFLASAQLASKCDNKDLKLSQSFYSNLSVNLNQSNEQQINIETSINKDIQSFVNFDRYKKQNIDSAKIIESINLSKSNDDFKVFDVIEAVYFGCNRAAFREALLNSTNIEKDKSGSYQFEISAKDLKSEAHYYHSEKQFDKLQPETHKKLEVFFNNAQSFSKNSLSPIDIVQVPKSNSTNEFFVYLLFGKTPEQMIQISDERAKMFEEANRGVASETDEHENEKQYNKWINLKTNN